MKILFLVALGLATVAAIPTDSQRIVGGTITTIETYPYATALLFGSGNSFIQLCGGSILNNRSVLSAAHCFNPNQADRWRIRVGSTNSNSGGVIHLTSRITNHPSYNSRTYDSDVAVLRAVNNFVFRASVAAGRYPSASFTINDNASVWAIGWGRVSVNGAFSERLRHVNIWVVNQTVCRNNYAEVGSTITANMLCAGWINVGGRDQCQGDSGGPLILGGIIVGVCSWGRGCGQARFPGVNARVPRFISWITSNS